MVLLACEQEEALRRLTDQLRAASAPTLELISKVVVDACSRVETLSISGKSTPIDQLIRSGAWTDASLAIVEFELPMWTLRRLIFDAREWFCSLSRHPTVPIEFDDTADGRHEARAIAILLSFVEAKRRLIAASARVNRTSVPHIRPRPIYPFCCDNFG
jgi:hypothetical protein